MKKSAFRSRRGAAVYGALAASAAVAFALTPVAVGARVSSDPAGGGPRLFARYIDLPPLEFDRRAPRPALGATGGDSRGEVARAPSAIDDDERDDEQLDGVGPDRADALAENDGRAQDDEAADDDLDGESEPALGPLQCVSRHRGKRIVRTMQQCAADASLAVRRWRPDTIVVLGGGLVFGGEPGCATSQRAFAAWDLFEQLERRPILLLSGRGPGEPTRTFDHAQAACERSRLARELEDDRALHPHRVDDAARKLARFEASHRGPPTEASQMCAAILRRYDEAAWPTVLSRVRFENGSRTTVENVRFSTPMLRRLGARRVLVLSTPVVGRRLDNHPERALYGFRWARREDDGYQLAAIGCPFVNGGPSWSEFEGGFVD